MYSSLVRLQNTFGFFTSVAFFVAALIATTDFLAPRSPSGILRSADIKVVTGRPHYYSTKKEEYSQIKFSLDADLSSLFTWNTKQVFVYVTAEWPEGKAGSVEGSKNVTNQAVIWDSIITAPSSDHLANITPSKMKRLRKQSAGKSIDPSRGILKLKNESPKYKITHPSGKMASAENVVLRLHYNVQPWVGILTWNQGRDYGRWKAMSGGESKPFKLPALKKVVPK